MFELVEAAEWYLEHFWVILTRGLVVAAVLDVILVGIVGWLWVKRKREA